MVQYCVAYGCKNLHGKGGSIHFHSFPFKRPEILQLWLTAIRRDNWTPSRTSRLCSEHFKETDYLNRPGDSKKILKFDAVVKNTVNEVK
ncbi:hypothetical protein NQ318_016050 [Aromia moschata]|uniref:THAP-type domain-containing protein n=1 Tax=Aromia moschata TaxID=1265417 RepID=A0AAV8Y2P8_9CUCU|nr:hypothetical protein NQ318_016050 [Aromia moschata]